MKLSQRALKHWLHFGIAAASFIVIYFLRAPFPLIVLVAGLVGLLATKLWPEAPATVTASQAPAAGLSETDAKPFIIDDQAPASAAHSSCAGARTQDARGRLAVVGIAAALSVVAFVALYQFKLDVLWAVLAGGLIGLATALI